MLTRWMPSSQPWRDTAIREPLSEEASQAALLERWKSKKASKMESRWSTALTYAAQRGHAARVAWEHGMTPGARRASVRGSSD